MTDENRRLNRDAELARAAQALQAAEALFGLGGPRLDRAPSPPCATVVAVTPADGTAPG